MYVRLEYSHGVNELQHKRYWQMKILVIVSIQPLETTRLAIVGITVARPK